MSFCFLNTLQLLLQRWNYCEEEKILKISQYFLLLFIEKIYRKLDLQIECLANTLTWSWESVGFDIIVNAFTHCVKTRKTWRTTRETHIVSRLQNLQIRYAVSFLDDLARTKTRKYPRWVNYSFPHQCCCHLSYQSLERSCWVNNSQAL